MLNKQKSHVMYQLIAGIKYPSKQAGILSRCITLIAPGLQSHWVTVCFNFYRVYLAAPSPLSPSALTLSSSKQLLVNLLSSNLPHPFSFLKVHLPDGQTPFALWGEFNTLGPIFFQQICFSPWSLSRDVARPKSQTSFSAPAVNRIYL